MEGCGTGPGQRESLVNQGTMGSGTPGFRDSPGSRHSSEYTQVSVCGVCECGIGFVSFYVSVYVNAYVYIKMWTPEDKLCGHL